MSDLESDVDEDQNLKDSLPLVKSMKKKQNISTPLQACCHGTGVKIYKFRRNSNSSCRFSDSQIDCQI